MTEKKQISFKITDVNRERLERFREEGKYSSNSDALNEVMTRFFTSVSHEEQVRVVLDEYLKRPDLEQFLISLIDKRLLEKFSK